MAPKGKKAKKGNDDWDADMGETIDPIAQAEERAKAEEAEKDADQDDAGGGGGLMAALKKNRDKKKKKGKNVEDFVEGEDPPAADGDAEAEPVVDLAAKAPEEANLEDEDVFAQPVKKGKGGKQAPAKKAEPAADEGEGDEDEEEIGGKVKTKAQKEKEKKEREKQRKKEQVR